MISFLHVLALVCVCVGAAPPTLPRLYRQHAPAQLQQIQAFDYYLENQDVSNYYQAQQKQAASNAQNSAPSRLENLEPDSEVELIPGAQQPQQPPQQSPVAPNLPGLVPGQRVFIVHMPVPGYRPGSIGGYQPVYIVAAAPQANAGYPHINGYQNAILLDPSGQAVFSPLVGYRGQQPVQAPPVHPGFLLSPQLQSLKGGYELQYQEPGYQPVHAQGPAPQQGGAGGRPVLLSQLIALQNHANAANNPRTAGNESSANTESKRLAQSRDSSDSNSKEAEEQGRNARPLPAHAQNVKA